MPYKRAGEWLTCPAPLEMSGLVAGVCCLERVVRSGRSLSRVTKEDLRGPQMKEGRRGRVSVKSCLKPDPWRTVANALRGHIFSRMEGTGRVKCGSRNVAALGGG